MYSYPGSALWADYIPTLNKLGIPEEKVNFSLLWAKRHVKVPNGLKVVTR